MTRRAIWLCAIAGAAALLTGVAGADAAGSPGPFRNGLVAFVRCCGPETGIYVIRPDGTGETRIFRPAADDAPLTPAWSPDGRQIAFVPGSPRGGIWVMRGNGARQRRVTPGKGDPLFPSWSPGAGWIVFADLGDRSSGRHDLYVVRANGSGLRRLTQARADETHPAWAPNRGEIAYERGRDLWRMRLDGTGQRLLARNAQSPSWSPGGSHVAFIRQGDPWVVARDGRGAKRVRDLPAGQSGLAWSPDGRWLVTAPFDRGDLALVGFDGEQARRLTSAAGYGNSWPAWQRLPR